MKKKFKFKPRKGAITSLRYILAINLTIAATVVFTALMTRLLFQFGILDHGSRTLAYVYFIVTSAMVSTGLSYIVAKKFLFPIIRIATALQKVADGDFTVELSDKMKNREVSEMTRNFNIMTRELRKTEIIHSDFITNVSHEIKTPLSAIEGYAGLLNNENLSDEKKEIYISKIIQGTKRLSGLTDNVLLLSKLENQEIEIQKNLFSLDEQIREILLLYEKIWSEKSIDLDIDLEAVDYCGNAELLSQVWQNIIGNAIKFTDQFGKISISLQKDNEHIRMRIADTGVGMSDATQKRLFEKFYQGDTSHTGKGNGLGLALAKKIIDLHNGEVHVESKQGEGTVFIVTLP